MSPDFFRIYARYAWLLLSVAAALVYALGAGMADYLGVDIHWGVYFVGQVWVLCLLLAGWFLTRYFDDHAGAQNLGRKILMYLPWKAVMQYAAVLFLASAAAAAYFLIRLNVVSQGILALMILGLAGSVLYAAPPLRLSHSGYGELALSVGMGALVPAFSFLLQHGEFHRILLVVALPLAILHLVMLLTFEFAAFAENRKKETTNLLMRMGWENGATSHNVLLLMAFLLIGLSPLLEFPSFPVFPAFTLLPLAAFQVYLMVRIAGGSKPNWNALTTSGMALFGVLAYIFAIAFWMH
jgi:1,4-dihydroxy-2-naphthoate octaprenyltransferase